MSYLKSINKSPAACLLSCCEKGKMSLISARVLRRLLYKNGCFCNSLRTVVSPSFSCDKAWNDRYQSEALKKINAADHFRKIKHAFDTGSFVAAIDMDIVSNKLLEIHPLSMELLEEIFYRFRHTNESVHALKSTTYAFLRTLMDCNEYTKIMSLLEDKPNFGLFLNPHLAIMLMDHFIEEKSYLDAARVVFDLMLQEDFEDPIVKALSFYTCHLLVSNTPDLKIEAPPAAPKDVEIVYRRVKFIETPWYDDHFDLYSINQKLGKSLTMLSKSNDLVSRGYLFLGNILYLKFDKAMSLMKNWMGGQDMPVISERHLELAESLLRNMETAVVEVPSELGLIKLGHLLPYVTEEQKAQYISKFEAIKETLLKEGKVAKDFNVDEYMKGMMDKVLAEHQEASIERQKKLFDEWNKCRDVMLNDHLKKLAETQMKNDLAKRLIDLKEKEEKLKYFQEKLSIDLAIENRPDYPEIKDVVIEEQFVAPPGERRSGDKRKAK